MVGEFSFGGMPHERAERNMRLFASQALPVLHNDEAFRRPMEPMRAAPVKETGHEDVFAPA